MDDASILFTDIILIAEYLDDNAKAAWLTAQEGKVTVNKSFETVYCFSTTFVALSNEADPELVRNGVSTCII